MEKITYNIAVANRDEEIYTPMKFTFSSKSQANEEMENFKAMDRIMGFTHLVYRVIEERK